MRKIIKSKNICVKSVHNLKSKNLHKKISWLHMLSKDLVHIYNELNPIYLDINADFDCVDLIDLKNYERWLNG